MRILVLGGTEFVGRAVVAQALSRGHQVSLLNRGRHQAPPGVTVFRGDRTEPDGLAALQGGRWDVVVDTWSAAPYIVREAVQQLATQADRYVYVSSRSVYTYPPAAGLAENAPLVDGSPDDGADGEPVQYPQAKRGAEIAVQAAFGDRGLLARAGLILGPDENVGRLPWWLLRIARGGAVLAPGPKDLPLQYIDARDLARWMLDGAENGLGGAYNLVSPPGHTTMAELLESCIRATGSNAVLKWIEPEVLLAAGVQPWTELPIWLPPGPDHDGMHGGDVSKALSSGLSCRPIAETVADTWAWLLSIDRQPPQRPDRPAVGLDPATESLLLQQAHVVS
jgi:2'-hydroxyisoflavone reductase